MNAKKVFASKTLRKEVSDISNVNHTYQKATNRSHVSTVNLFLNTVRYSSQRQ